MRSVGRMGTTAKPDDTHCKLRHVLLVCDCGRASDPTYLPIREVASCS
jgi:hypothetical protein